jgi:hypothetical protein
MRRYLGFLLVPLLVLSFVKIDLASGLHRLYHHIENLKHDHGLLCVINSVFNPQSEDIELASHSGPARSVSTQSDCSFSQCTLFSENRSIALREQSKICEITFVSSSEFSFKSEPIVEIHFWGLFQTGPPV